MSFERDLQAFAELVHQRTVDVVTESAIEVQRSVVEGSALTGAAGQPVDTGALRSSYIPERIGPLQWRTTTGLEYASAIEDGMGPHGPMTLKSPVGGFGSVAKTEQGWPKIVEHAVKRVVR